MKKLILTIHLLFLAVVFSFAQTPLSQNGRLRLVGNQLSNECGNAVQLRGMSTHGIMPEPNKLCYTEEAVRVMAQTWKADVFRLAVYPEKSGLTPGYIDNNQEFWNNWIDQMVQYTEKYGIYVIIDWHILYNGNPNAFTNQAKAFFTLMSSKYKNKKHVIYEIANEPNGGVSWDQVKSYAQEIIPVIRANDTEAIILVGNPSWSSDITTVSNSPLGAQYNKNVMYTYHFYANTHLGDRRSQFSAALSKIPVFVSEWGTVDASGNGGFNSGSSDEWLSIINGNNPAGVKVSWANWSWVDKDESASVFSPNTCAVQNFGSLTTPGQYIFNKISSADAFTACPAAADADKDGVADATDACANTPFGVAVNATGCPDEADTDGDGVKNYLDLCAATPSGTVVNIYGCPITGKVSNACNGVNNKQGFVASDFSEANKGFVPDPKNPVYDPSVADGKMVIAVTNADPDFKTMTFNISQTGVRTALTPVDVRGYPVIKMDVNFKPTGPYPHTDVVLDFQLEDAAGKTLNADVLGNYLRPAVKINQNVTLNLNFKDGYLKAQYGTGCTGEMPCYTKGFDFSKVVKIHIWVNPNAGNADWTRATPFTGTWTIDNFSIGQNPNSGLECTVFTDTDGDQVADENDLCPSTPAGEAVNASGCSASQLDDDKDNVKNNIDRCPGTLAGATVNEFGCSDAQLNADDDNDDVKNGDDLCPATPATETSNAQGCSPSQLDDDNDGTPNSTDKCPLDPNKIAEGNCGCGTPETGCTVDCNGVKNGTAYIDNCDICVGGNTGKEACVGNPYGSIAQVIPGVIEAEKYDLGGADVAFNDATPTNQGGQFREDEVDIELVTGSTNNYNIGYTAKDEWLNYTVNVLYTGTYDVTFRIASETSAGAWHLLLNGQPLGTNMTGGTPSGGWQTWKEVKTTQPVTLTAGSHVLTLHFDGVDLNVDNMTFTAVNIVTPTISAEQNIVSVYPIPAADKLNIDQTLFEYNKAVIMDITGTVVKEATLSSNRTSLNLDNLAKGTYMIQLIGNEKSEFMKVVIQ